MLIIDGARGEGGGQVVRTSLALSALTSTPVRIRAIRAKRSRPGLLRQHLTALRAMTEVCSARVRGAELGSRQLEFEPGAARHGRYQFAVGTAGSATLVFQTVLPALLSTPGESTLVFEGGTHNAWAPPFDFIAQTFVPLLQRMGAQVQVELERPGFYPAGGGRFVARVAGGAPLRRLELLERGAIRTASARALVAQLPVHIAERELRVLTEQIPDLPLETEAAVVQSPGPGNAVVVSLQSAQLTETFTGFGAPGVKAESVSQALVGELSKYLAAGAPVGEHLADQLLLPLAWGEGGGFVTGPITPHTRTNLDVIEQFLPGRLSLEESERLVHVRASGAE